MQHIFSGDVCVPIFQNYQDQRFQEFNSKRDSGLLYVSFLLAPIVLVRRTMYVLQAVAMMCQYWSVGIFLRHLLSQCQRATVVALNHYNIINATQPDSHCTTNIYIQHTQKKQSIATTYVAATNALQCLLQKPYFYFFQLYNILLFVNDIL